MTYSLCHKKSLAEGEAVVVPVLVLYF